MAAPNGDAVNPTERPSQPQLQRVATADFKRPCLDLSQDTMEGRNNYFNFGVPLFKFASEGNWEKAKPMLLDHNKMLLSAGIAQGWPTVLHIAAGAGHLQFVKELVDLMDDNNIALDLQDIKGNTALSLAGISGNLEIAKLMCERNPFLPKIRSGTGFTPLLFAALQGKADVANYLYSITIDENFEEAEWNKLFLTCIDSDIYDLALKMLEERSSLAFARNEDSLTGLHIMAQKATYLGCDRPQHQNQLTSSCMKNSVALELVRLLWERILSASHPKSEIKKVINEPSGLLFDATKVGNFDFLAMLLKAYPDLIWELNEQGQSIIHIAVLNRHPKIFNLIHAYSGSKNIILAYEDEGENNILHLAAKLAPANRLELIPGAAFQMKLELLWFKEVKKIVLPSYINKKNWDGKTPHEIFTKEHAILRKDAESWMKKTADSCMLVSTIITTGVLAAAFSVPGGINDDSGTPNYLRKSWFMIFAISDAIAMISSSASIVAFLSILVSRYAEDDFYKSLPSKLMFGMVTLFISITSTMVTFSSAFFVTYNHNHGLKLKWVPYFISVLSFLPIAIFLLLKGKLFYDILYSTYYLSSLFKPTKHMLY